MEFKKIKLGRLELNKGQIHGLPANPRKWTKADVEDLAKSMAETPELAEARGAIVVPFQNAYVVLGGNMRVEAARKLGWQELMCAVLSETTPVKKLKEIVLKDNSSFGSWDQDLLKVDWAEFEFQDIGIKVDFPKVDFGGGLSTRGREGDEEYNAFVDKFKQKLTTDDCYTPAPVYDAVLDFVRGLTPLQGREDVRPFWEKDADSFRELSKHYYLYRK